MSELNYNGVRIVQTETSTQCGEHTMGFTVKHEYTTLDDFDDHALAVCYHRFWSPVDACMVVDIDQWQAPQYGPKAGSWRCSYFMAMRARPAEVREALLDLRQLLDQADQISADAPDICEAVLDRVRKLELDIR